MDVEKFKQEKLEKECQERDKRLERVKQGRIKLEATKKAIAEMKDLPEKTDALEKIEASNGREVEIVAIELGRRRVFKQKLEYEGERVLLDDFISCPLIGNDCITEIVDAKTKETIYENTMRSEDIAVQKAILLGKQAGLAQLEREERSLTHDEEWANEFYDELVSAFEKAPKWIERGNKIIYPQLKEKWEECVYYRVADLYRGSELRNAIEIMEALAEGKTVEEASKLVDKGHSGMSHSVLCNIVVDFSKKGVEFYKANSARYGYISEKGSEEKKEELENQLKEIEKRNGKFERELEEETSLAR